MNRCGGMGRVVRGFGGLAVTWGVALVGCMGLRGSGTTWGLGVYKSKHVYLRTVVIFGNWR